MAVARGVRGLEAEPGRAPTGAAVGSGASPCSCPGMFQDSKTLVRDDSTNNIDE